MYKTESDLEDGDYTAYGKAFIADNATAALAVSLITPILLQVITTPLIKQRQKDLILLPLQEQIDASQTNVAATIYVSTTHSTTDTSDIESWDKKAVEFLKDELTKTITIKSNTDGETEGSEYFWLDVFKTKADAEEGSFAAYDVGYLKDNTTAATAANTYKYTITTPAGALDPVTEGSDIMQLPVQESMGKVWAKMIKLLQFTLVHKIVQLPILIIKLCNHKNLCFFL